MYKIISLTVLVCLMGVRAFAQNKSITEAEYSQLKTKLEAIYDIDQGMRDTLVKMEKANGWNKAVSQYAGKMWMQDKQNLKKVEAIIEQYGWLPKSKVGKKAAAALFYVVQHSNVKAMEKYLPIMKLMAKKGESFPKGVAMMEDRILTNNGKKQIYGTQVVNRNQGGAKSVYFVWPIEDVKNVNKRRKEVGFTTTIEEYAKEMEAIYDPNEPLPSPQKKKAKKTKAKKNNK